MFLYLELREQLWIPRDLQRHFSVLEGPAWTLWRNAVFGNLWILRWLADVLQKLWTSNNITVFILPSNCTAPYKWWKLSSFHQFSITNVRYELICKFKLAFIAYDIFVQTYHCKYVGIYESLQILYHKKRKLPLIKVHIESLIKKHWYCRLHIMLSGIGK